MYLVQLRMCCENFCQLFTCIRHNYVLANFLSLFNVIQLDDKFVLMAMKYEFTSRLPRMIAIHQPASVPALSLRIHVHTYS